MSTTSNQRADEFLRIAGQFRLGELVTEAPHPKTACLSSVAETGVIEGLKLLFEVDRDVLAVFEAFVKSGRVEKIAGEVLKTVLAGGKVFFTGCGSTGRLSILLDSMWRDFWQREKPGSTYEHQVHSVMAGGDFALIKAVEGFEDYTAFGRRQIADLGVTKGDVVFAVTEGGETSFVIGTAWEGLEKGAKVYFVYNNPDDVLCRVVERSRKVIEEPRIEKVNLTTGPMAVCGSTRMQATSIHLCVLSAVLEAVVRELTGRGDPAEAGRDTLVALRAMHATLSSDAVLQPLARLASLEERTYRRGGKCNYYADHFGIDVLTDTTERSPTYCVPPFRKADDGAAADSWAFLYVPEIDSQAAWRHILKREPRCVAWPEQVVQEIATNGDAAKVRRTINGISNAELMRFRIGHDGLGDRLPLPDDCAIGVQAGRDMGLFQITCILGAEKAGANVGLISFQPKPPAADGIPAVHVPCGDDGLLLDGVTRVGLKMLLNSLSTCVMVRLGRVRDNWMVWVVPSNLKLIDRSVRYVVGATDLDYESACRLIFEVIEYVEPRMRADQAYPPVVQMAVLRARESITNSQAERRIADVPPESTAVQTATS